MPAVKLINGLALPTSRVIRLHSTYVDAGHPQERDPPWMVNTPSYDQANRHIRLYRQRMPWKKSQFSPQIVPGYIHPAPKDLIPWASEPEYWLAEPQVMHTRHLGNYTSDKDDLAMSDFLDQMDDIYTARMKWKQITPEFVQHVYAGAGYDLR